MRDIRLRTQNVVVRHLSISRVSIRSIRTIRTVVIYKNRGSAQFFSCSIRDLLYNYNIAVIMVLFSAIYKKLIGPICAEFLAMVEDMLVARAG